MAKKGTTTSTPTSTPATRKPRQPKVYPDEQALVGKLEALDKTIGDKTPTDAQKDERKKLRSELGALKFKRLAKQRVAKCIIAIRAVGKLGGPGYTRTEEQITKIEKMLVDETAAAMSLLQRAKAEKESLVVDL